MIQWVPNLLEQRVWRECAPPCLPREMVEYVAFYLCDARYKYQEWDKRYFSCLRWMCGTKQLKAKITQVIEAHTLPPDEVAQEILQLYLTHPMDILANTQDQVVRWFDQITKQYNKRPVF